MKSWIFHILVEYPHFSADGGFGLAIFGHTLLTYKQTTNIGGLNHDWLGIRYPCMYILLPHWTKMIPSLIIIIIIIIIKILILVSVKFIYFSC